jgi:hypothetical protein
MKLRHDLRGFLGHTARRRHSEVRQRRGKGNTTEPHRAARKNDKTTALTQRHGHLVRVGDDVFGRMRTEFHAGSQPADHPSLKVDQQHAGGRGAAAGSSLSRGPAIPAHLL